MNRPIFIFLVGLMFLSFGSQASWEQLWNKQVDTVIVDQNLLDGTTRLFATEKATGDLYQYEGTPSEWTKVGGKSKSVVSTGEDLYLLRLDGKVVFRYLGPGNRWKSVYTETSTVPFLTLIGGGNKLYATKVIDGDIWEFTGSNFKQLYGSGKYVAGGCKGCWDNSLGFVYRIEAGGTKVYRYPKGYGGDSTKWVEIGEPAGSIYAGSSPQSVFATEPVEEDSGGDIWRYKDGTTWEEIGGPGKMFAVDVIGKATNMGPETLYGLSGDGKQIWRWVGQPEEWTQIDTSQLNKPLQAIYAGGGKLYAVASGGRLWEYSP
ncbi:MAG: hypothetical protein WBH08_07400 [Methanothrix sp.]|uniref:hypothetical protein n=1 Tax=Methanothrix sp. TaxID=90426 RepID=UPI003BB66D72